MSTLDAMSANAAADDPAGYLRGIAGLVVRGELCHGRPIVAGAWGSMGLGYSSAGMREAAHLILAACDQADALAARAEQGHE